MCARPKVAAPSCRHPWLHLLPTTQAHRCVSRRGGPGLGALPLGAPEPDPVAWAIALGCSPHRSRRGALVWLWWHPPTPLATVAASATAGAWAAQFHVFLGVIPGGPVQNQVPQPLRPCVTPGFPVETVRPTQHERLPSSGPGGAFSSAPLLRLRCTQRKLPSGDPALPAWPTRCPPYGLANAGFRGAPREAGVEAAELVGLGGRSGEGGASSGSACPPASWGDTAFPSVSQS